MRHLLDCGDLQGTRVAQALVAPTPVTTVYSHPTERVHFDSLRDANPFFHMMESVWMLAGSRDGRWLDYYVGDFSKRYAESDGMIHGAYGHRWRNHFEDRRDGTFNSVDQITEIGRMLYEDSITRRCVMAMWDPETDLGAEKADLPCNTSIMFRTQEDLSGEQTLDITVCNRSNDAIFGAYGANVVHMSVLGEVVAGLAGMRLGTYYQVSNNFHAYKDVFDRVGANDFQSDFCVSEYDVMEPFPIVSGNSRQSLKFDAEQVLKDCEYFVANRHDQSDNFYSGTWCRSHWMLQVVLPMHRAHSLWKSGKDLEGARAQLSSCAAHDWSIACDRWMTRRVRGVK
jgi:thymidylate synthase